MAKDPRAIGLISISASARNRFSSFFRSARLLCLSLAAILNCITEAAVKVVVSLSKPWSAATETVVKSRLYRAQ